MREQMTAKQISDNGLRDGDVNFLAATCKTAAVAVCLALVGVSARFFLHPRLNGVFHFIMFFSLAYSIVAAIYGDTYSSAAWAGSAQIGAQFRAIAESSWSPGNSWFSIGSASGFYDWLRNPMKDLLFAGAANKGCGAAARANPDRNRNKLVPIICNEFTKRQTWFIVACQIRQVRVLPKSVVGTAVEGVPWFGGVKEIYPEFKCRDRSPPHGDNHDSDFECQDKSARAWNSSSGELLREMFLPDVSINAFEIEKSVPHFSGSKLIGATYPGQSGQVFGGRQKSSP